MLTQWRVWCPALMLSDGACGGKSAQERVAEHDRVRVSWEQTARFAGAEWIDRAVPDQYAARTLARVSEELRSERTKLQKDEVPADVRVRLVASLTSATALADSLKRAIRAHDRAAATNLVERSRSVRSDSLLREAGLR
jgi:hypothetical protein